MYVIDAWFHSINWREKNVLITISFQNRYILSYYHGSYLSKVYIVQFPFIQEEYTEGCSDGTFPATGEKIFECPPGHGFYFPLANVRPDERFDGVPASTGVSLHDNRMKYNDYCILIYIYITIHACIVIIILYIVHVLYIYHMWQGLGKARAYVAHCWCHNKYYFSISGCQSDKNSVLIMSNVYARSWLLISVASWISQKVTTHRYCFVSQFVISLNLHPPSRLQLYKFQWKKKKTSL